MKKINQITPDPDDLHHSDHCKQLIAAEIVKNGPIDFAQFMELALYAPGAGYYNRAKPIWGRTGDYITAPELTPLFSRCIANQCHEILLHLEGGGAILEIGAGSGTMALQILKKLQELKSLPSSYYILEKSPALQKRQQQLIMENAPDIFNIVVWLNDWPSSPFNGVVVANELLDAMPVHKFKLRGGNIEEYYIDFSDNQLIWKVAAAQKKVKNYVSQLPISFCGDDEYESEINCELSQWVNHCAKILNQGIVLIIDYGFPRREYYHPQRNTGTIMCHYQHVAHSNPLINTGIQDITAHVDFTAVAEAASTAEMVPLGFTHQAAFLCNTNLILELEQITNETQRIATNSAIKILTSPFQMGELFKVIALGKNYNYPLGGFSQMNYLEKL